MKSCIACGAMFDPPVPVADFCDDCFKGIKEDGVCPVGKSTAFLFRYGTPHSLVYCRCNPGHMPEPWGWNHGVRSGEEADA